MQAHGRGIGELRGEVQQVAGAGSVEGVNGLVGVAHDGEVVALAEPGIKQALLQRGDVLILVDHEGAVLGAELLGDTDVGLDGGGHIQQQVVEVQQHALGRGLELLIVLEDLDELLGAHGAVAALRHHDLRVVLRDDERGLAPLHLPDQVFEQRGGGFQAGSAGGTGHQRELGVHELPRQVAGVFRPEVAQLAHGGGVEGAGLDARDVHHREAFPHLGGGPRGEGHGQYLVGVDEAAVHEVGDAVGDGAGLAGARARDDGYWPAWGGCCAKLFRIQVVPGLQLLSLLEVAHATDVEDAVARFDGLGLSGVDAVQRARADDAEDDVLQHARVAADLFFLGGAFGD